MAKDIQELLSDLHDGLARHLMEKLQEGIITTGELNILRQFLKDNPEVAAEIRQRVLDSKDAVIAVEGGESASSDDDEGDGDE